MHQYATGTLTIILLTLTFLYICTYSEPTIYTTQNVDKQYLETYRQYQIYQLGNETFVGVNAVWHHVCVDVELADLKASIDETYR